MESILPKQTLVLTMAVIGIVGAIVWLERPPTVEACTKIDSADIYALSFSDGNGSCYELSEFRAPVTVINVWASWCPFCVEELPDLDVLAREYPKTPVVAINRAESVNTAQEFLESLGAVDSIHFLFDPQDTFYRFIEGFGMPETIFIDSEGTTLFHKRGVMSLQEMRDTVELLTSRVQPNSAVHNNSRCLGNGELCGL